MIGQGRATWMSMRCAVAMTAVVLGGGCDPTWTDPRVTGVPSFSVREVRYLRFASARRDATGATVESARGTSALFTIGPTPGMAGGGSAECRFRMRAASTPEVLVEEIDPCIRDTTPAVFRLTARGTATRPGVPASMLDFQSAENTVISPPGDPVPIRVPLVQQHVNVWIEPTRGRWVSGRGNPRYEHNIVAAHTIYMNTTQGPRVLFYSPSRQGDPDSNNFVRNTTGINGGWEWDPGNAHKMEIKLWNPLSGAWQIQPSQHFGNRGVNLFCSGHSLLPDGRIATAGGHHGGPSGHSARWVHLFDPERPLGSRIARASGDMIDTRWYPTTTVLPNGRVLISSGNHVALAYSIEPNRGLINPGYPLGSEARSELFDPATNALSGSPVVYVNDRDQGLYPALFVLPRSTRSNNSQFATFFASQGAVFHFERRSGYLFQYIEDATGTSRLFPTMLEPSMTGLPRCPAAAPYFCERAPIFPVYATKHVGSRSFPTYGNAVMLPLDPTQSTRARILVVGGQETPNRPVYNWEKHYATTNTAEIFDYDADREIDQQPGWRSTSSMQYSRILSDATLLADGDVLVSGGASTGWSNDSAAPVLEGEIFDSESESWHSTEPSPTERRYHATAILLADATVLSSGSHGGFSPGINNIVPQFHSDVFQPPYLFRAPPPRIEDIDGAPASPGHSTRVWAHGEQRSIIVSNDEQSALRVAAVRFGAVTHGNHMDQRFIWLPVERADTLATDNDSHTRYRLTVRLSADRAMLVPGQYMIFVLNRHGVPSAARFVVFR
jgi:hypothetical protein